MKKKLAWRVLLPLAMTICLVVFALVVLLPVSQVTKANYDRIEKGMSVEEVESILGGRATYSDSDPKAKYVLHLWHPSAGDQIRVVFDENRRVCNMSYRDDAGPPYSRIQKFFDRIDTILGRADGKRHRDSFFD